MCECSYWGDLILKSAFTLSHPVSSTSRAGDFPSLSPMSLSGSRSFLCHTQTHDTTSFQVLLKCTANLCITGTSIWSAPERWLSYGCCRATDGWRDQVSLSQRVSSRCWSKDSLPGNHINTTEYAASLILYYRECFSIYYTRGFHRAAATCTCLHTTLDC